MFRISNFELPICMYICIHICCIYIYVCIYIFFCYYTSMGMQVQALPLEGFLRDSLGSCNHLIIHQPYLQMLNGTGAFNYLHLPPKLPSCVGK